jgi:hypothetical protein
MVALDEEIMDKPSFGVIVGRFQVHELHQGHLELLQRVWKRHNRVILFLGCTKTGPTRRNPLDFETRKAMIQAQFPEFIVVPLQDKKSDEEWSKELDARIADIVNFGDVTLYGSRDCFAPYYHGGHRVKELEMENIPKPTSSEEMSFNSQDGMQFTGDVSLSYAIDPVKAADFYVKYRITDLDQFTHGVLKNIVRDELNRTATNYTAEQLYGDKKSEMLNITKAQIEKLMNPLGVGVQQFGFIHPPRPPEPLVQAINAKIQAVQQAEKARNELATTQAEAAKVVAEAEGTATAQVTRAKGEAEANKIRNSAITTQLLEMRRLDNQHDWIYRWNGEVPKVSAGQGTGLLLQLEPK